MASATQRRLQVHLGPTLFASGRSVTLSVVLGFTTRIRMV